LRQDPPENDFRGGRKRDILLLHGLLGDQQKERLHVIVVDLFFEYLPERDPEYILQRGGRGRKTDMRDCDCNFCVRRQTEIQKMSTEEAEEETFMRRLWFCKQAEKDT
jgi:hypothetical protein